MPRRAALALVALGALALGLLGARYTPSPFFPVQAIRFLAGTAAVPSVTTVGDENTGLFFPAAGQVSITVDGVELIRFHAGALAAAAGGVDLGTATGSRFRGLHLSGAISLDGGQSWLRDNVSDFGTSTSTGRARDAFFSRDLHVAGYAHIQSVLAYGAHVVTIASNGVSGTANAETLSGLRPLYLVECLDGDGCSVTIGEASVAVGSVVRIVNVSTSGSANHNLTLSDAAPLHLAGALTLAASQSVVLIYGVNRSGDGNFYEMSRSAN